MLQKFLIFIFIISTNSIVFAQQHMADSIEIVLSKKISDSARAKAMLLRGMYYEKIDSAKAHQYYNELINFAAEKKMDYYVSKAFFYDGYFYNLSGNSLSATVKIKKAISIIENKKDEIYRKLLAQELASLSGSYLELGDMKQSPEYGLREIKIKEELGTIAPIDYLNMGNNHQRMKYYDEEKKWFDKALSFARETHNEIGLFQSYLYITMYFVHKNEFNTAKNYIDSARFFHHVTYDTIAKKASANIAYANYLTYYLVVANVFQNLKHYDSAVYFYHQAYLFSKQNNVERDLIEPNLKIGYIYILTKNYAQAEIILLQALKDANANKDLKRMEEANQSLSQLYSETNNYKKAFEYYQSYSALSDSISGLENQKYIKDIETRYETEKKDSQIQLQQVSIKQKNILNYVFAGTALGVIFLSIISYRNYKHRQTIQQQRIIELETEKQLTATEAVLHGEEKERTRIAKDLHDGLGGMLSGIKFSLNNMKGNLIMTPDNAQAFERSMDMLDNSIKEMRRVAHNMMPEALMRYGLDTALKDFSNDINSSGIINVIYQSMGVETINISQSAQITIYRIVQELINNTIKHASASQVLVQVFHNNDKIILNVEDDGKGFNADELQNPKGIGWKNIQSRVDYLKGTIYLQTQPGKGTIINIELKDGI